MTVYRWSDGDDTVTDAVIVGIAYDSFEPERGASTGPILASVYWPQRLFQGDKVQARMEGPFEPAVALSYAEEIAKLYQFPRVVVAIQARNLWNDAWGRLAPDVGFD